VRWLCLLFPDLALDAWQRASPKQGALAILDGPSQRQVICGANPLAQAGGARTGMPWAAARALLPDLCGLERNLQAEQQALQQLAGWAYQYSSRVALCTQGLQLEIAASHRLFGKNLLHEMHAELTQEGWQVCFGHAPTPAGARLAARYSATLRPGVLRSSAYERIRNKAPLALCELPGHQQALLESCGIRSIAELQQLPAAGLIRRIGRDGLRVLAQLSGGQPEPLEEYRPPARYQAQLELPAALRSSEALLFPIKRMLGDFTAYLRGLDCAVQHWQWLLHPERGNHAPPILELPLGLLSASRDPLHLLAVTKHALERVQLLAPIQSLSLKAEQLWPYQSQSGDLFARQDAGASWPQLLERLRSRLGSDAVQQLSWQPDHRPERSWCTRPSTLPRTLPATDPQGSIPCDAQKRPLWLLPEPRPIAREQLRLIASLERIETGWWDEHDIRRDYYLALDPHGMHIWVYQELRPPRAWFQHGVFG